MLYLNGGAMKLCPEFLTFSPPIDVKSLGNACNHISCNMDNDPNH